MTMCYNLWPWRSPKCYDYVNNYREHILIIRWRNQTPKILLSMYCSNYAAYNGSRLSKKSLTTPDQ